MSDRITIKKRSPLRGEDGNKVISIRIKEDLLGQLDALATQSNRSRNEVINPGRDRGVTRGCHLSRPLL